MKEGWREKDRRERGAKGRGEEEGRKGERKGGRGQSEPRKEKNIAGTWATK